jgi:competence protein ComEA
MATPAPIQVHVDGEVISPGLYSLPRSSRIADAVEAAGGLTDDASTSQINLAAPLLDGSKVYIPKTGETITSERTSGFIEVKGENSDPSTSNPLNINTATIEQLVLLPGIGSTRAADIIYYRQVNGDFKAIEDLLDVPGIGETTYNQIKDLIKVTP